MDLENFFPDYPDISEPELQQDILNKKEFFDLKLGAKIETIGKNEQLLHQKIIQRFVNNNTLYDELLLVHETGTGKTGVAFGVSENLFDSKSFKKVYVLARGGSLLISLMKQLVFVHSNRYTVPPEVEPGNQIRYIKRITSDFYQFQTYETFCKGLSEFSDEILADKYNNSVFILDEVHNIKSDEKASIYAQFYRLFHLLDNRKILLMSATPMRDDVNELSYIMNLILPEDMQLPIDTDFNDRYIQNGEVVNTGELKEYLRGRVSFLSSSPEDTRYRFMGKYINDLNIEQFKVYSTRMSKEQSKGYSEAFRKDTGDERSIYANSRQASLFVFPDGSYGPEGVSTYVNQKTGTLKPDLYSDIFPIERLRKYSSKYAFLIQNILENPKKLVYIYCSVVNGSGINILCRILERYGFSRAKGTEKTKGLRYIALTSQLNNIDLPLGFFNSKRNMFGDYCQVIIGSRKIAEGFTFKNIQIVHILTFHWNITEIQQAIARAIRYKSHDHLLSIGYEPMVQIYQHANLPDYKMEDVKSIDIMMMETSQRKDILIRRMNRVLKEISFDCPLTYERNVRDGEDNSRECDYQECEYTCESTLEPTRVDLNTYNLYYQNIDNVISSIQKLFSTRFSIHLQTLQDLLELDTFILLKSLYQIITLNIPIVNKFGLECYLREDHDVYYLVDNILNPNDNLNLVQYSKTPFITRSQSLNETIRTKLLSYNISIIRQLKKLKTKDELRKYLDNLSANIQEMILEMAVVYPNSELSSDIITIYKKYLKSTDKYAFISILNLPKARCFDGKTWNDCIYEENLNKNKDPEKNNEYGVYGIHEGDNFCIKEIVPPKPGKRIDKREQKTGSNCLEVGWNKPKLSELCVRLNIPIPPEQLSADPVNELSRTKTGKKTLLTWQAKGLTINEITKGLYWYKKTKEFTCSQIKQWLNERNLLIKGECGKSTKKK